jgi:hypothetical protein
MHTYTGCTMECDDAAGAFYVKCCLAVIDSQKLCGLNCSRERWLLQEPALSPGWSLNDRGSVHSEGPCDHLQWLPSAQAPVVGPNFPPGPLLHCASQNAIPQMRGVLRSLTSAEHSDC